MNILPRELREQVALLRAVGVGVREVSRELGVTVESVGRIAGYRSRDRQEIMKRIDALYNVLDNKGLMTGVVDEAMSELHAYVLMTCPLHPEDQSDAQLLILSQGGDCIQCRRDGMVGFHARRKAEGRPIVPPWRREGTQPSKKRVCRKCGEAGHFAKTCRATEPAKAEPAALPDWRSI